MDTLIHLLRHAETRIDPNTSPVEWHVTEEGAKIAQMLASSGVFDNVDLVVSSAEYKAIESAQPFAERLGLETSIEPRFNELERVGDHISSRNEYLRRVKLALLNQDSSVHGWETAANAIRRFKQGIRSVESKAESDAVLVVSHGLVLSLYFATLLDLDEVYDRWLRLEFCSWGTVKNQHVIKDIV
ncbi:MAG: histidine phosphatase family protein [Candidatus Thorarchaeota archaeon]